MVNDTHAPKTPALSQSWTVNASAAPMATAQKINRRAERIAETASSVPRTAACRASSSSGDSRFGSSLGLGWTG